MTGVLQVERFNVRQEWQTVYPAGTLEFVDPQGNPQSVRVWSGG